MRAVFSATVLAWEEGPQYRVSPIFFDLATCVVFIITLRHLVFSDYPLLDLMDASNSLKAWRDSLPVIPPTDGDPNETELRLLMPNAFTTTIPIY